MIELLLVTGITSPQSKLINNTVTYSLSLSFVPFATPLSPHMYNTVAMSGRFEKLILPSTSLTVNNEKMQYFLICSQFRSDFSGALSRRQVN